MMMQLRNTDEEALDDQTGEIMQCRAGVDNYESQALAITVALCITRCTG